MSSTAENLRELHSLHQRARAIRDRLVSGPKTLASREAILATKQAALEQARKALKDAKAHNKNREVQLQSIEGRIDDLKIKRNSAKKQAEYDGFTNQIAHDQAAKAKVEDEILQNFDAIEAQSTELARLEAEAKQLADEVTKLRTDLDSERASQEAKLRELEAAITSAEEIIPADQRDQYRRVVKQRGADAMAAVEMEDKRRDVGACSGCYVSVTTQMLNELHHAQQLVFCKTCGRILYVVEDENVLRRH